MQASAGWGCCVALPEKLANKANLVGRTSGGYRPIHRQFIMAAIYYILASQATNKIGVGFVMVRWKQQNY